MGKMCFKRRKIVSRSGWGNDYLILLGLHMEEIHMDKGMTWTECGRQMGQSD